MKKQGEKYRANLEHQLSIIRFFSGLELGDMQKLAEQTSLFLETFRGVKNRKGKQWCRLVPCRNHQYSRGVCATHYRFLSQFAKLPSIGWPYLAGYGLCELSEAERYTKDRQARRAALQMVANDPLEVLIKKSAPNKRSKGKVIKNKR